ncbi:MAG: hypothetical protein Q4A61_02860 [Porphyromonadaceae bacterium]|nr:hypothetical protein [Porphyromonadaceae bacterium]
MKKIEFLGTECLHRLSFALFVLGLAASCQQELPRSPELQSPPHIQPSPTPSIPEPDPSPTPSPSREEAEREIVAYFEAQLDADAIALAPGFLYAETLREEDVTKERAYVWSLWQRANTERLERHQFANITSDEREVVWDIPQGERIKSKLFAKGMRPEGGYPLFINLHGGGQQDTEEPWGNIINTIAWEGEVHRSHQYTDAPSIYFVPRMADDRIGRWYLLPQRNAFRRAIQLGWVSGQVDPERTYILGTSEGGYGSHRLALFMPDYFAGAGPMAAAEPLKAAENLRNIAFGLQMGQEDKMFHRAEYAQAWQDKLAALQGLEPRDFVHRIQIEAGRGHGDINFAVMTPWLGMYKRRTYPERVSYLYYNMTADYAQESYVQGVYYLDLRRLHHTPNASMFFHLERKGNEFHLTSELRSGIKVWGQLGIYIDEMDLSRPIRVLHNGTEVFNDLVVPSKGAMVESLALWGDPKRIFAAKISVPIL